MSLGMVLPVCNLELTDRTPEACWCMMTSVFTRLALSYASDKLPESLDFPLTLLV